VVKGETQGPSNLPALARGEALGMTPVFCLEGLRSHLAPFRRAFRFTTEVVRFCASMYRRSRVLITV